MFEFSRNPICFTDVKLLTNLLPFCFLLWMLCEVCITVKSLLQKKATSPAL